MTDQPMTKVPFNCRGCGADFQLYHDGITMQHITVVCRCGFKADDSVFAHPIPPALHLTNEIEQ